MVYELLAIFGVLFLSLIVLALFGRLILGILLLFGLVFIGLPAVLLAIVIMIITLPLHYAYTKCTNMCKKEENKSGIITGIIINGNVVKCDKCYRNAVVVFNKRSRCEIH